MLTAALRLTCMLEVAGPDAQVHQDTLVSAPIFDLTTSMRWSASCERWAPPQRQRS